MLVTSVPASRQLAAARAHARFHDARSEPPEAEPEPEFETVAGQLVIDTCPSCGTVERVAVHDGLCPECTSAPPASNTPRRPQPSRPPF